MLGGAAVLKMSILYHYHPFSLGSSCLGEQVLDSFICTYLGGAIIKG